MFKSLKTVHIESRNHHYGSALYGQYYILAVRPKKKCLIGVT